MKLCYGEYKCLILKGKEAVLHLVFNLIVEMERQRTQYSRETKAPLSRLELPRVAPQRPQRCASTNSATTASW